MWPRAKQRTVNRGISSGREACKEMSKVIWEMQIKTTLRFHHTYIRKAKTKTLRDSTCWQGDTPPLLVGMQTCTTTLEINLEVSQKTRSNSTSRPGYTTPGYICNRCPYHRDTCSVMFTSALFIIARNWKRPRRPAAEEWVQTMWYICTVKYYSATKNKDIMNFSGK